MPSPDDDESYFALPDHSDHATLDSPPPNHSGRSSVMPNAPRPSINNPGYHVHLNQTLSKVITSLGNFSVQYNFQAIAIALIVMSQEECTSTESNCKKGQQESWVSATSSAVVFAGAIFGQCGMGYLGDALGRDQAMTITLSLATVGAMLSAVLSVDSHQPTMTYLSIVISRFILGIGLGGVYPLSATKAAEDGADDDAHDVEGDSSEQVDSTASAKAFFWQTPGAMAPWALAYIFTFYPSLSTDTRWRLLLGLGAIPAAAVAILSHFETQTKRKSQHELLLAAHTDGSHQKWSMFHQVNAMHNPSLSLPADTKGASGYLQGLRDSLGSIDGTAGGSGNHNKRVDRNSVTSMEDRAFRNSSVGIGMVSTNVVLLDALRQWKYQKKLLATGGGWFLYDVAFYGVNLFGGAILEAINKTDDNVTTLKNVRLIAGQQLIALGTAIPACILTIVLLKRAGTKSLQIYGFILIAFMFILIASLFEPLQKSSPDGLYAIYCLLLFSLSFGPNVTTYVLPAETYPKEVRATFNGISAAMGKIGAVVGASLFKPIAEATSYPAIMIVCAVLSILGAMLSWKFIDHRPSQRGERPLASAALSAEF